MGSSQSPHADVAAKVHWVPSEEVADLAGARRRAALRGARGAARFAGAGPSGGSPLASVPSSILLVHPTQVESAEG